ncbi:hypothetical protein [Halioxenophilus sp. WMMB6]|uniref:hypothetical protein n=1 Tax=Halioxenophilus sp. WMMB6 TaxID=3073815 RepID=UPI00295E7EAF|nr:hypothetical protein [Halioxenophilus sp. WMMB6]
MKIGPEENTTALLGLGNKPLPATSSASNLPPAISPAILIWAKVVATVQLTTPAATTTQTNTAVPAAGETPTIPTELLSPTPPAQAKVANPHTGHTPYQLLLPTDTVEEAPSPKTWLLTLKLDSNKDLPQEITVLTTKSIATGTQLAIRTVPEDPNLLKLDQKATLQPIIQQQLAVAESDSDYTAVVQRLAKLITPSIANELHIPPAVKPLLSALAQVGIHPETPLTPEKVKELIANSGQFLEARTHSGVEGNKQDTKGLLIEALKQWQNAPSIATTPSTTPPLTTPLIPTSSTTRPTNQMHSEPNALASLLRLLGLHQNRQSTGRNTPAADNIKEKTLDLLRRALIGIQANQIRTLTQQPHESDNQPAQQLLLQTEIPFVWANMATPLRLEISRRDTGINSAQSGSNSTLWHFDFTLELPQGCQFTTRGTLSKQSCRLQFWASHSELQKAITNELLNLQQALKEDGIELEYGDCVLGSPPKNAANGIRQSIINTRV